jgi:hypothetical protein
MSFQFTPAQITELGQYFAFAQAGTIEWYLVYERVLDFEETGSEWT